MLKRILAGAAALLLVLSVSACSINDETRNQTKAGKTTTVKETRVHNNFKDTLPEFDFDSEIVEKYSEGISYTFSAECSEGKFDRYINKVQKAGYENNAVSAFGYYAAYNAENYYVEITLVNDMITVFVKRT